MNKDHLEAEQRTDKHGNVVTRWVRRMIGVKSARRTMPSVSLPSSERAEMKALLKRMTKGLPSSYIPQHFDSSGDVDPDLVKHDYRMFSERKLFEAAYAEGDYEMLKILDQQGSRYGHSLVCGTVKHLRAHGVEDIGAAITPERMAVMKSFHQAADDAVYAHGNAAQNHDYNPEQDQEVQLLARHVATHLDDSHLVGMILGRGIINYEEAMGLLKAMKAAEVPAVINDGFL